MYKDLAYFYGVCISVSIGMWACSPRKIDSTSSILQGEESCSGEPSRFVEMPPNCQHKVLSNLSDKQLIIFAKAVSKSTSKAGFAVLLDRAKLTVPESLQSEIENYASKFYQCMDIPQSTSIKASPVFVERLLAFYLSYVKLMNTRYPSENFPKNPSQQFEIGRFWIPTPVNPVVLGKKNVVYVREKKDDARRFLEVRDSATFKLKSSKELVGGQSAEIALQALGPQVLLVKDSTGKTIWTFAENQWTKHKTFASDVEVLGVKNRDVFFTLIGNQLTRYTLVNNKFHSESFGQFPIASPQKMLGTKEDQLLTFETAGGYSYLKIWSLSRESINLKNTFKYEGSHRDVELHERNILTFIMVRRDQFSYLFVDTEGLKEVLRINEPSSYGSPLVEHKIRFLDENTFAVSQRVNRYDFEIQIYSGQNWDQIKFVNSLRDLAIPAIAILDRDHIVFYGNATGGQVRIGSVRSAFPTFSVFPRQKEYFWDWTDTLESAAGGFLAISRNGFAIHSPWKKILETNSLTL